MTSSCVRMQIRRGAETLKEIAHESQRDAALLLYRAMGKDRAWLLAHPDVPLTVPQMARYDALLARRLQHEPIQYILGEQEFYGLPLKVTPAVLIPRPETEHLVEAVLEQLPKTQALRIADVGTGSGAIALALASQLPLGEVDAFDISADALAVAEENARVLGLKNRVRCLQSDLLEAAGQQSYDCIVSNPPYVASTEVLETQVAQWEPHTALFAGPDGLAVYRQLLPGAAAHLLPGGLLAVELGAGQQAALTARFAGAPCWSAPQFVPDRQAIPRVALVRLALAPLH